MVFNGKRQPGLLHLPGKLHLANLNKGKNSISIILAGTAQNFFGHHRRENMTTDYRAREAMTSTSVQPPVYSGFGLMPFGLER